MHLEGGGRGYSALDGNVAWQMHDGRWEFFRNPIFEWHFLWTSPTLKIFCFSRNICKLKINVIINLLRVTKKQHFITCFLIKKQLSFLTVASKKFTISNWLKLVHHNGKSCAKTFLPIFQVYRCQKAFSLHIIRWPKHVFCFCNNQNNFYHFPFFCWGLFDDYCRHMWDIWWMRVEFEEWRKFWHSWKDK